jgi:hypothetical protein
MRILQLFMQLVFISEFEVLDAASPHQPRFGNSLAGAG